MNSCRFLPAVLLLTSLSFSSCDKVKNELATAIFQPFTQTILDEPASIPATNTVDVELPLVSLTHSVDADSLVKAATGGQFGMTYIEHVTVDEIKFAFSNADSANNVANFRIARLIVSSDDGSAPVTLTAANIKDEYNEVLFVPVDPKTNLQQVVAGNKLT
jgi:hypothetical protein